MKDSSRLRNKKIWDSHYKKQKSILNYPDENLVRLMNQAGNKGNFMKGQWALDLGCGSGRHLFLLRSFFANPVGLDIVDLSQIKKTLKNSFKTSKDKGDFSADFPFLVNGSGLNLPFSAESFPVVIAWGSLHYGTYEETSKIILEIGRILQKGGIFWGTLRGDLDTYLSRGKKMGKNQWEIQNEDIKGSMVTFFSREDLNILLGNFKSFQYGIMERTRLGKADNRISHFFFEARK